MLVIFTKLSFTVFNIRCFLLLSYFLVVKDYDLSQRTSRLLSVLLTLEYVTILSWPISFLSASIVSQMMFFVRMLSGLMILLSTHHVCHI